MSRQRSTSRSEQIIGQQGDESKLRELMNWLREWEKNRKKPASKCEYTCI